MNKKKALDNQHFFGLDYDYKTGIWSALPCEYWVWEYAFLHNKYEIVDDTRIIYVGF